MLMKNVKEATQIADFQQLQIIQTYFVPLILLRLSYNTLHILINDFERYKIFQDNSNF